MRSVARRSSPSAAGYKPGPMFKELLTAVEDAQLDGKIAT
jgi:hypothetical protein